MKGSREKLVLAHCEFFISLARSNKDKFVDQIKGCLEDNDTMVRDPKTTLHHPSGLSSSLSLSLSVCVYLCNYVTMYVSIFIYIYMHVSVCMYACMCMCMYCVCVCVCACVYDSFLLRG
jgi:hypothetical protein